MFIISMYATQVRVNVHIKICIQNHSHAHHIGSMYVKQVRVNVHIRICIQNHSHMYAAMYITIYLCV